MGVACYAQVKGNLLSSVPPWLAAAFPDLTNIAKLGEGGQKSVFRATHPTDGAVVLKIVHQAQLLELTQRELLAVQRVDSERVPKVYADGIVPTPLGNVVWILEQCVMGVTLRERLVTGPLSPQDVIKLGAQMLGALAKAEAVDIVHRDVKPDNIMIDQSGDFWLLDFGIARHLALPNLTPMGSPFGKFTPGYAPIEQCRNVQADIDARADLFALGVTMYEAATNVNPFYEGANGNQLTVMAQVENKPMPLLKLSCKASQELEDLVSCMTQKQKVHRPMTAQDAFDWIVAIVAIEAQP
jgi:eukaryotic-like serine/threonine-protein kinase